MVTANPFGGQELPGNRGSPGRQEHEEDDNPAEARRRWLRALSVLSTLLAIAWSMRWAATASAADATEQAVLAAHEKRRDATLAGDAAAVGSMMTDDLTFTHANAVVETKAEFLDALKTGRYQYKSLTDEERGVRVHGDTESSPGRVALS